MALTEKEYLVLGSTVMFWNMNWVLLSRPEAGTVSVKDSVQFQTPGPSNISLTRDNPATGNLPDLGLEMLGESSIKTWLPLNKQDN